MDTNGTPNEYSCYSISAGWTICQCFVNSLKKLITAGLKRACDKM